MILTVFLAQVIALLGWDPRFPWSIPALLRGAAGPSEQGLRVVSYLRVVRTGLMGLV